jgi:CheY-like chemotaxis protein
MGGDLTVTSAEGQGSSFRLAVLLTVARAGPGADAPLPPIAAAPGRRLVLLCVEDNPYGRVILNAILAELGHRADFAGSGEEAAAAVTRGYDAVLMDVTLPGIDGLDATRRIRSLAGGPGRTPIIGISGRTEAGDEDAARAAGMDAHVRKPLSPGALSAALAAVVSSSNRH